MRNVTLVQVKMNGTEYFRKTISATGPLDVNVLYLGGMPQMGRTIRQVEAIPDRSEITKPPVNFKGVIQDVQVTEYRFHGVSWIPFVFCHVDFITRISFLFFCMFCPSYPFWFHLSNSIRRVLHSI